MVKLGKVAANLETATRASEFVAFARMLALAEGRRSQAAAMAEADRVSPRVVDMLRKSAVEGGTFGSGNWAEQLGDLGSMIAAFIGTLKHHGAFDAMLPSMKRVPLRTRLGLISVGVSAAIVPAGHVTPISEIALAGNGQIDENKALAMLAMSRELARLAGNTGNDLFGRELRKAIALVTDEQFISIITDGVSPITSNGGTAIAILQDLAAAFDAITTDADSDLFILVEPATAKAWATKTTADGAGAFPGMGPSGGQVANTPVVVTDGLASGTIVVADATQIAANAGTIEIDASGQADIQLNTAPDSPVSATTVMQSLWQHDNVALKAMRFFGAHKIGTTAVAVVEGVSYSGNSPN